MTDKILNLLRPKRKPAPVLSPEDQVRAEILELQTFRVRQLGDRVRDLDRWRDGYRLRTGRAA